MFDARQMLAEELQPHVEKVEATEVGLRVVAGKTYCIPWQRLDLKCSLRVERRIKLIEEFILRIGAEVRPCVTLAEAAALLGLDELFLRGTYAALCKSGYLSEAQDGTYQVTPTGLDIYQRRVVLGPTETEDVALDLLPEFMTLSVAGGRGAANLPCTYAPLPGFRMEWPQSETSSLVSQIKSFIESQHEVRQVVKDRKLVGLHLSEKTYAARLCAVFLAFDTLIEGNDNLELRVVQLDTGSRLLKIEEALSNKIAKGELTVEALVGSPTRVDPEPLAEQKNGASAGEILVDWEGVKRHYRTQTRMRREQGAQAIEGDSSQASSTELIFDHEIRPRFLHMLREAKQKIVIISPWISENAVDEEVVTLLRRAANRGVTTFIGWGIARAESGEDRRPSDALLEKLNDILNPQGFPAVLVFWLGNQHRKNILIDDCALLAGSHNLLSYRGDYLIRGEEAIYITESNVILQSKEKTTALLHDGVKRAWQRAVLDQERGISVLVRCCMAWMADEQFETLILSLDSLLRDPKASALALEHLVSILRSRVESVPVAQRQALRITLETIHHEVASRQQAAQPAVASKRKPTVIEGLLRWRNDR